MKLFAAGGGALVEMRVDSTQLWVLLGDASRRSDADADAAAIHAAAARTKAMSASYREAAARRAAQQPAKKTCVSILRRIFSLPHQTAERREQAAE